MLPTPTATNRPPPTRNLDAEIAQLVAVARDCRDREDFRAEGLRRLQTLVGFDSAAFASTSAALPTTLNKSAASARSVLANFARYAEELRPIERAALASGGVAMDGSVLSEGERDRMRFYAEIARPQGVRSLLVGYLTLRGEPVSVLFLARHDRAKSFDADAAAALRALLPALSLGDGVHPRETAPSDRTLSHGIDWSRLSRREREVVQYVSLGLRNAEIALACGSSPNTVRNQLASVFQKLGVANRTELARVAAESGFLSRAGR